MTSTAKALCRKQIEKLTPYASARRIGGEGNTWINANEAPGNHCVTLPMEHLNRYPEFQPPALLNAYSAFCQLPEENLLITRGADEGIELLIRTFCEPGYDSLAFCPPTYGMYAISAETCGVDYQRYTLDPSLTLPFKQLLTINKKNKLLFLCHPNNPTGQLIDPDFLEKLLKATQGKQLIVIDEAYIEFCLEHDVTHLITHYDNLVVLRTLSKAFGLAALRCGFVLAHKEIIQRLRKVIAPYPVPAPTALIATRALSEEGLQQMHERVNQINEIKQQFIKSISTFSDIDTVFPSEGNFVIVRFHNAQLRWEQLQEAGIIARAVSHYLHLENCIRFSIGTAEEMQQVVQVLKQAPSKDN